MSKSPTEMLSAMSGTQAELFKFWISFWPVAPAFGVEWRFAEVLGKTAPFEAMPGMAPFWRESAAKPAPAETKKPKRKPAKANKATAEITPAADAAVIVPFEPKPTAAPELDLSAQAEPAPADPAAPMPTETAKEPGSAKPETLFAEAPATVDDLQLIKGIGPGLESKLNALGVYRFDQIAGFSMRDLEWIDENLTTFKGRCFRDDWVGQAKTLLG
ncbi:MAG: hypothetical protein AAGC57_10645 [Pseudomonadota bacterium]